MVRVGGAGGSSGYYATATYGLVAVSGEGTDANPFKGYYWRTAENFDAVTVSTVIPVFSGYIHIKSVSVYYTGAAGVAVQCYTSLSTSTTATLMVAAIGERKITTATNDCLVWSGLDRTMGVGALLVPGKSYYNPPQLLFAVSGYAATDDMGIVVELEWSVEADY